MTLDDGDLSYGTQYEEGIEKTEEEEPERIQVDKRQPRVNFLGAPEFYNLNAACLLVTEAFRGISFGTFHVGSSITRRDYRDVDVRCIMRDDEFERMFAAKRGGWSNALWSLMCVAISAWLKERTGLPIDFQIQSQTEANGDYPNGERNALGLYIQRHQVSGISDETGEQK
jgi:hypothetical protein